MHPARILGLQGLGAWSRCPQRVHILRQKTSDLQRIDPENKARGRVTRSLETSPHGGNTPRDLRVPVKNLKLPALTDGQLGFLPPARGASPAGVAAVTQRRVGPTVWNRRHYTTS